MPTGVCRRRRSGIPFRLVAEADHDAVRRPHGPLPAPPVTDPVPAAQAAQRAGMVVHGNDAAAELLRNVRGQAVPQQPVAVGQPDAPSPPVVRNPPHMPGRASPENLGDSSGRNAHFDAGCATLPMCGRHVVDVHVPEVPPCRRAPAFEPARPVHDLIAAGLNDGGNTTGEPMAGQSPRAAFCVGVQNPRGPKGIPRKRA
jgi:hypothetical protein